MKFGEKCTYLREKRQDILFHDPDLSFWSTAPRKLEDFLQIVAEADEAPLGFGLLLPSHRESPEALHLFDDPEDGFDGLLTLLVEGPCFQVY